MGNTDSQNSGLTAPAKNCSFKFSSRKQEVQSPHSWWRSSEAAGGHKPCSQAPYTSWSYEHRTGGKGGASASKLRAGPPLHKYVRGERSRGNGLRSYGYLEGSVEDGHGPSQSGGGWNVSGERGGVSGGWNPDRTSPKVLLSKDGSMRVEFSNARVVEASQGGNMAASAHQTEPQAVASLRNSKGSSLSSEGSWYDSPWGNGADGLAENNVFSCHGGRNANNSSSYSSSTTTRTEDTCGGGGGGGYSSSGYNTLCSTQVEDISPRCSSKFLFPPAGFTDGGGVFVGAGYGALSSSSVGIDGIPPRFNVPVDSGSSGEFGPNATGYNTCSSGRTEDSGIGDSVILQHESRSDSGLGSPPPGSLPDLYACPGNAEVSPSAFPAHHAPAQDSSRQPQRGSHSSSSTSSLFLLNAVIQEERAEGGEKECHSSRTLPCRGTGPGTAAPAPSNSRKDLLKSRIRRLSDWTGSLSRKKRRLQEPCSGDVFTGGVDSGLSDCLWSSNPLHIHNQPNQFQVSQSGPSFRGPPQPPAGASIYQNFMQELAETGCDGTERTQPSEEEEEGEEEEELEVMMEEGEDEEVERSSSGGDVGGGGGGSLGSLEQLDLLLEKEQGVVRRAGWLSFKALITLNKERRLEMVARRKWKHYWVTLKGCTLLFYESYGGIGGEQDAVSARYALLAQDSLVQPVPEHPRKENVFCLSNSHGDVFLFQASNQTEVENWVTSIHSACSSLLARRQGKEDTLALLRSHTRALLHSVDMDAKMRKMAELQLSVITDHKNRKAVESQIQQWDQNLEKLNVDVFRLRSYQASLQGSELPNPKRLLAAASKTSKSTLGRLGVFSASSFHALVCSREEGTLRRRGQSLSRGEQRTNRRGLLSSLKVLDTLGRRAKDKSQSTAQVFEGRSVYQPSACSSERLDALSKLQVATPPEGHPWYGSMDHQQQQVCVSLPDGQVVSVSVRPDAVASDLLHLLCKERQLDPGQFCVRVRRHVGQSTETRTAQQSDPVRELVYDELELFPLNVFTLHLSRPDSNQDFGFAVTGHVDGGRRSHLYISEVSPQGLAHSEGLRPGDEILVLNGTSVCGLDLGLMHTFFNHQKLQLVLRREEPSPQEPTGPCPQPPPPPSTTQLPECNTDLPESPLSPSDITHPPAQNVDTVFTLYQTFPERPVQEAECPRNPYSREASLPRPCPRHMSVSQRLCKVIQELVDTEKSYVKDLSCLFEIYLTPLQNETFLSKDEMESLFGSLPEMLDFQRVFLHTLEERIASCPNLSSLDSPEQFKNLLFSLGGSFLYYADHFKLYSGFCANHIKVQKVLERAKTDRAFKEFLEARNPTKQHSSTLESYLIKPVQRVLKYPLLLRELVSLTDSESQEHRHLTDALRAMEKVASHINEMQKIYEDYGSVFDQLAAEHNSADKEVTEISMGEFLIHSSETWLNPVPSLGRMRRDPEITLFVFKRAVILVYRDNSKMKKRMTSSRSGDLDPFKFRWLIPVSAVQVRMGNVTGSENPCVWELVHTKSELEGRPETVFQLCSSGLESKASVVKALRSLFREGSSRRTLPRDRARPLRGGGGGEPTTGSLRRTKTSDRRGAGLGSWRSRRRSPQEAAQEKDAATPQLSDEGSTSSSSGGRSVRPAGDTRSEPRLPSQEAPSLPSLEGDAQGKRARLCSLTTTSALELQLQRLNVTEEEEEEAPQQRSAGYDGQGGRSVGVGGTEAERYRTWYNGLQRNVQRTGGAAESHLQGEEEEEEEEEEACGTQTCNQEYARKRSVIFQRAESVQEDLNSLLERDYSIQSLTSVVNEDCFFDNVLAVHKAIPTT